MELLVCSLSQSNCFCRHSIEESCIRAVSLLGADGYVESNDVDVDEDEDEDDDGEFSSWLLASVKWHSKELSRLALKFESK